VAQIVHELGGVGRVNAPKSQGSNDLVIGTVFSSQSYGEFDIRWQNLACHNGKAISYRQERS
jgi:hypothetical protein